MRLWLGWNHRKNGSKISQIIPERPEEIKKTAGCVYARIFGIAFTMLNEVSELKDVRDVKPMKGYPNRYRIRVGDYRVGIEVHGDNIEVMRTLHRREFYKYFP